MQVGLIGLGRMGYNLALNMRDKGHQVVAFNRSPEKVRQIEAEGGITGAYTLEELVQKLAPPRTIWMMIPAGEAVEEMIRRLTPLLSRGDLLIDGGNSFYQDTLRRAEQLRPTGIHFMDVGTSGGIEGARYGACTMAGGDDEDFARVEPLLRDISVAQGYIHAGPVGSGHFVKMVHNGIEYGMMQAMGEGFEVLAKGPFSLNLKEVARVWNHGSVIRGWLMELAESAFAKDPRLEAIRGVMHSSGEGLWTAQTALNLGIPAPIIALSVMMRHRSEQDESFAGKVVAALRNEFGGHAVEKAPGKEPGPASH
ncbi:MAG: decarboxylating 6-phosphogluconate dehydrogenase [Firmicutes bacterium]|nr:decarboxylating 6-phosphogluconate dehydrogenase [Bacillota bacterium]